MIFANGRIAYIDALLLASGGATQAGLNTVDVNNLTTFQQCVIFFLAMLANPITVNSFVVFLRLYWFEKRFEHIVLETRGRRLFTFSKSKSMAKNGESLAEMGVNGRNIRVMHGGGKRRVANDGTLLETDGPRSQRRPSTYRGVSPGMGRRGTINGLATAPTRDTEAEASPPQPPAPGMQLKFAETVKRSDGVEDSPLKLPVPNEEASIAILQKQRGGGDDGETLRIPGPRDAERGAKPKRLEAGDLPEPDDGGGDDNEEQEREGPAGPALHTTRATTEDSRSPSRHSMQAPVPETQRHQTITIEEPERRMRDELLEDAVALAWTAEALGLRKPRIFKDGLHSKKHHSHHSNGGGLSKSRTNASRVLRPLERIRTALSKEKDKDDLMPYLSWQPTLGRNSAFVGLTEEQREELGGIEYRSLKTLAMVLAGYYWGFWIFAVITLLPWILHNSTWGPIVDKAGVSRAWWGIFTANSAFNDLGFTLTPDSMNSFNTAQFPLLIMSFLIICGNTGFPIMLRFIIWILSKVMPRGSDVFQELHFLLDHPRRCFTLLFPSSATWWLFWVLVILNVVDLIFFVILDVRQLLHPFHLKCVKVMLMLGVFAI